MEMIYGAYETLNKSMFEMFNTRKQNWHKWIDCEWLRIVCERQQHNVVNIGGISPEKSWREQIEKEKKDIKDAF